MPNRTPTALWQAARDAGRRRAGAVEPGDASLRGLEVPPGLVDRGREVVDQVHRTGPSGRSAARAEQLVHDTSLTSATTGAAALRRLGIVSIVLGIVGAAVFAGWGLWRFWSDIDAFARVDGPGSTEVRLDAGPVLAYDESGPGAVPSVTLRRPDGGEVPAAPLDDSTVYELPDHTGRSIARFEVGEAGSYTLEVGPGSGTVALGPDVGGRLRDVAVGTVLVLLLGVAIGVGLLVLAGMVAGAGAGARRRADDPFSDLPPAGPVIRGR